MREDVIDQIYEAASIPSLWGGNGVLDTLARIGDCTDGVLFAADLDGITGWTSNAFCRPKMDVYVRDNWVAKNPYLRNPERERHFSAPRFILDTEVMSPEEMAGSEYYEGFCRPYGLYWHAGTSVAGPTGDIIKISVHRDFDAGPLDPKALDALTQLRPHLARAALLTARLRFEQVRAAVDAFNMIGLPAAALRRGRLAVCNAGFEELIPHVIQDRGARLTFATPETDKLWSTLLEKQSVQRGGSFPVKAAEPRATMISHVLPIVGAGADVFTFADTLMIVASPTGSTEVDSKVLEGLFDLTAAEAAIARELALGSNIAEVARNRQVSESTVRTQLKSIFGKTGVNRQVDLVRLLLGSKTGKLP